MVYRFQLTYDETIYKVDIKYIPLTTIGYTLPPGMYEIIDNTSMVKSLLPKEVKVNVTIDDVRLRSILTTNKTIESTKKSFLSVLLRFTQPQSAELGDIPGFVQLLPGTYKTDKPINVTSFDKFLLKCDFIQSSIVNGIREPILYCSALSSPPGHKIYKKPGIKLRRGNFWCFRKFLVSKNSMLQRDMSRFPSKIFCHTVPKFFVEEPFGAVFQKLSGSEKVYG